uniref:Uncharacterized protein n=1 Tax=Moniliophthora roreri TaxID=221103 RepID=A0A0W0FKT9_MONRR
MFAGSNRSGLERWGLDGSSGLHGPPWYDGLSIRFIESMGVICSFKTVWREWIPRRTGRLVYIATQTLIAQGHLSNIFPRLDIRPSANTLSMDVHLPFVEDAIFWLIGVAAAPDEERYKVKQTPYSMKSLPSLSLAVAMAHYLLSKTRVGCRAST